MARARVTIDAISGFERVLYALLPRRRYIDWRIKGSPLLRNALASGADIEVQLPGGEQWMIRANGKVERASS